MLVPNQSTNILQNILICVQQKKETPWREMTTDDEFSFLGELSLEVFRSHTIALCQEKTEI